MMKKLISVLLCAAMLLCLGACGSSSSEPEAPSKSTVKADVQDYLTTVVDEGAAISVFEIVEDELDDDQYTAIANAFYTVDGVQGSGEFTLEYEADGSDWELISCSAVLDTTDDTAPAAAAAPAEETPVEEAPAEETTTEEAPAEEPTAEAAPAEETPAEPAAATEVTMSDNLMDFTFTLDGAVYQLPAKYTDFTANGWVISSSGDFEDNLVGGDSYEYVKMSKGGNGIWLYFVNMSGNARVLKDCEIGGIEVEYDDISSPDLFTIAQGVSVGVSKDDVTATFGTPNETSDSYIEYNTGVSGEYHTYVEFYYSSVNADYNSITLQNFVKLAGDETETDSTVPEYLASYTAPTELGSDVMSGNVQIGGDLYRVCCPLTAFTDNGWTISSKPGYVEAYNEESVKVTRNGVSMYLYVTNFAEYQTIPENCAVSTISLSDYSDDVELELPNGITIGMSKADVESKVSGDYDYYEGSYSYSWTWSNYSGDDFYLSVDVDVETGLCDSIYLNRDIWN